MNHLQQTALDEVMAYHQDHYVRLRLPNRTRYYKYLLPAGNDMEIHTVAVKIKHRHGLVAKTVVRASVDDPWLYVRDIAYYMVAGYIVDWSPEKAGPERSWNYNGRWNSSAWAPRCLWKLQCPVINPDEILTHPRFKYCAWTPACGDILDYLKVFKKHPRVELLSKAGAGRFSTRGGFVAQMDRDKGLLRFVMDNLQIIQEYRYGVDVIRMAYKEQSDLHEAGRRIAARREWRNCHLPRSVDATKAMEYVNRLRVGRWDYAKYLRNCLAVGLSLEDTKTTFPRHFKRRQQIVADRVAEIERLANAERAKQHDSLISKMAERFARLELGRASFIMVLPRKADDLVREGKRLHNCLGDGHYAAKMARGEALLAFIRKASNPSASFVAVEYDPGQKRITQCYADKNSRPPAQVLKFAERRFSTVRSIRLLRASP